jgi:mannose-6-phosphate isomerase-like protein (cupin superfamily)
MLTPLQASAALARLRAMTNSRSSTDVRRAAAKHFTFGRAMFKHEVAHNGSLPIFSSRVLEGSPPMPWSFIDLVQVPAGADIGLHTHSADNEEIYVIVSGTGHMQVDGEEIVVGTGDVIINRPGGSHGLVNVGDTTMHLVVVEAAIR